MTSYVTIINGNDITGGGGGGVDSITGTANQVIVSNPTGAVTLSLPQSIATTSTPTFGDLTLGNVPQDNTQTKFLVLNSTSGLVEYSTSPSPGTSNLSIGYYHQTYTNGNGQLVPNNAWTATVFDTVDTANPCCSYNLTTGLFTATTTAMFTFSPTIVWANSSSGVRGINYQKNASTNLTTQFYITGVGFQPQFGSYTDFLNIGDTVSIQCYQTSGVAGGLQLACSANGSNYWTQIIVSCVNASGTNNNPVFDSITLLDTSNQIILGTSPNQTTLNAPIPASNLKINLPTITANDTLVGQATAATLSNKTLVSPILTSIPHNNADTEILALNSSTGAVEYINVSDIVTGVSSITGTANQVIASASTGNVTLSLPQAIATTSTPTFGGLSIVSAAQPSLLINNGTDQFNSSLITSTAQVFSNSLAGDGAIFTTGGTGRILIGPEPGSPGSSPLEITSTFAEFFVPLSTTGVAANEVVTSNSAGTYTGIALSNGELLIGSNSAAPVAATLTGTANEIIVTNSTGSITLSLPQAIATTSSPTFTGLNLSSITNNNALTSLLVLNSTAVDYRTVASLGIPSTNSTVTYQGLILQGTTDSVLQFQTTGIIAYAGTNSYLFTNTLANDMVWQNASTFNILIGVGTGVSQLEISNTAITTDVNISNGSWIVGNGTCTIAPQTALGVSGSASITGSSQTGGKFTLVSGSSGFTTGILAIITMPFNVPNYVNNGIVISPQNGNSAGLSLSIYTQFISASTWGVYTNITPVSTTTAYTWNWCVAM